MVAAGDKKGKERMEGKLREVATKVNRVRGKGRNHLCSQRTKRQSIGGGGDQDAERERVLEYKDAKIQMRRDRLWKK